MNIYEQLGKRIAFLRKEKNLSQMEFALLCDINRNYLCDLENGRRNPSLLILNKIAKALEIDMAYLLKGIVDYTLEDISKVLKA